jgi:AcrR family transcriptional regulator
MRDRILETADRLFYAQGIRAVGVDTVAAEVGISKRTLYNHFPSKDALITAYLSRRFTTPGPSDAPPAEQILHRFERLERAITGPGFRGCPFINAVTELGESVPRVNEMAVEFKEHWRLWFRDQLTRLGVTDPESLPRNWRS